MRAARTGSRCVRSTSVLPPCRLRASAAFIIRSLTYSLKIVAAYNDGSLNNAIADLITFLPLLEVMTKHDPCRPALFSKSGKPMLARLDRDDERIVVLVVN